LQKKLVENRALLNASMILTVGVGLVPTLMVIEGNHKGLPLQILFLDSAMPKIVEISKLIEISTS
jgi:hypothetical protein